MAGGLVPRSLQPSRGQLTLGRIEPACIEGDVLDTDGAPLTGACARRPAASPDGVCLWPQ